MKNLLRDIFIEPFTNGYHWAEYALGIIVWLIALLITGLLLWLSLWLIDSSFLSEQHASGVIVTKTYEPAHETTSFILIGKVMVPQNHHYNACCRLIIVIGDSYDDFCIQPFYGLQIHPPIIVKCTYTKGRLFNTLYIKSIE